MADDEEKARLRELSRRMREEWNRRVRHDYRFWMSDGVDDDARMWEVGERDFAILTAGLDEESLRTKTALELGCGVGRLLRPASKRFGRVIGVDVSSEAIREAERLLQDCTNVDLVVGNGFDLAEVASQSVDFSYTFAALSSMPVAVISSYLKELSRVVRPGGLLRLQVYLGRAQATCEEDTLAIRSFGRESFTRAMELAGFDVESIDELRLPFEISDPEAGRVAEIAALVRTDRESAEADDIAAALVPAAEQSALEQWQGSRTEYLMALSRAQQHMDAGDVDGARDALEFAVSCYHSPDPEVRSMLVGLQQLAGSAMISDAEVAEERRRGTDRSDTVRPEREEARIERSEALPSGTAAASGNKAISANGGLFTAGEAESPGFAPEIYAQNLSVLEARFPKVAAALRTVVVGSAVEVSHREGAGALLAFRGRPLNHAEKPVRAGEAWAERALNTVSARGKAIAAVAGFADGRHLAAFLSMSRMPLHVFEPQPEILKAALGCIDCRSLLESVASLHLEVDCFRDAIEQAGDPQTVELLIHPQTQLHSPEAVDAVRRALQFRRGFQTLRPTIAVVGPMYGGSLPIAQYAADALCSLEQRVMRYDLSEFFGAYTKLGGFLKDAGRRGVVETRYIETISQLVLEAIDERPVDIVLCLAQAPLSPRVLTELRARGIITAMWFVEDCSRFLTWQQIAPYFDYMFLIQRGEYPQLVESAGAGRAVYVPVGCDPRRHCPIALSEEERRYYGSELSFVGAGYNNRRHVFSTLADRDFKIWGTEWPAMLPFTRLVQEQGRRISVEEYVKIFNASTININLHSSTERDGVEPFGDFVNPRTFELASIGAFQLVDSRTLLAENFVPNEEVAVFNDEKEMHDKIDYYLRNPEQRAKITRAGRAKALSEHTYQHRLKSILEYIYADKYEHLAQRTQDGPWPKTFAAAKEHPELSERLQRIYERGEEPRLETLVGDIQTGKGSLTETEQKLLFLHHVRSQVSYVRAARKEPS